MGWFSSKTKIEVFTAVSRVIEDNMLPNTLARVTIQSILEGQNVSDSMLEGVLNGPALNFRRMFQYAQEQYTYGLPDASYDSNRGGLAEVTAAIESEVGPGIEVQELFLDSIDNLFMGWKVITEDYGYDRGTNELTVLSASIGYPVYLDTMVPVHTASRSTNYSQSNQNPESGYSPERQAQVDKVFGALKVVRAWVTGSRERVRILTVHQDDNGTIHRDTITVDLDQYSLADQYFHVRYRLNGLDHYWIYRDGAGTYPDVDAIHSAQYTNAGSFYPFVFFRHNGTNRTAEQYQDTEEYQTTEKLLDIMGMDFQSMGDSIHENPDINDIEQAVMLMAVPLDSQNPLELRYLYRFFSQVHEQTRALDNSFQGVTGEENEPKNNHAMTIQDADFKVVLSYGRTSRKMHGGKIGPKGTYTGATEFFTHKQVVNVAFSGNDPDYRERHFEIPVRVFRYQVSDNLYEEIQVTSPRMVYEVYETGRGRIYDVTIDHEQYDQILIPLDKTLADEFSLVEQEELFHRSLHMVFNAKVEYKVAWYQTGFFKFILIVAAVGVMLMFPPAGTPALMAALGVGSSIAALHFVLAVVFYVLQGLLIQWVFKLVIRELDIEDAFIVTVLVTIAALAAGQFDSLAFMADNLLIVASGLVAGYQSHLKDLMDEYDAELQAFELLAEEKWEELEAVNELIDPNGLMDPFAFIALQPLVVPGEGPDAFYARTIDAGNIGTLVFEELENYVDNSLRLPTFADTLEGEFYAV